MNERTMPALKEKNIRYVATRKHYRVDITRNGNRVTRVAQSLDEAKVIRNELLYKISKGLPLDREATKGSTSGSVSLGFMVDKLMHERWQHTKSLEFYEVNTKDILSFFGEKTGVDSLKATDIQGYCEYCRERGNANGTINRKLSVLRTIVKETAKAFPGIAEKLPAVPTGFKESEGRIRTLSDKEEEILLGLLKAADERSYCGAAILLDTGLRESELVKLNRLSVDFEMEALTVLDSKNGTNRTIPLTPRAKACLKKALDGEFEWFRKGFLAHAWSKAKADMGLQDDPEFVPYCLRHTCATRLVVGHGDRKAMPISLVQYWMGHKNIETTQRYIHVNPRHLRKFL